MVTPNRRNPLRRADLRSEAWQRLRAHIDERLGELRLRLESTLTSHDETASLRGRIEELKNLVALEKAPQEGPRLSALLPHADEATPDSDDDSGE